MPNVVTFKGTLRQVFYLSEALSPPMTTFFLPYTLYTCIQYTCLFTQGRGGELTRENFREAVVHKAGRYQHDLLYLQSINFLKQQKRGHSEFGVFRVI